MQNYQVNIKSIERVKPNQVDISRFKSGIEGYTTIKDFEMILKEMKPSGEQIEQMIKAIPVYAC